MELTLTAHIVDYKPENESEFKSINSVWMNQFESHGGEYAALLENPSDLILAKSGKIFMAYVDNKPVGTCALLRKSFKQYEICLMAVQPAFQGKNIGKQLLSHALDFARNAQAKTVVLTINPKLSAAVELYKTHGFHVEKNAESKTVLFDANDITMSLSLM